MLGAADAALVGGSRALTAADELAERPAAAHARPGRHRRRGRGLARYQQVRDRLADRLGVDPSPQLEQAYLAILRKRSQAAAPPATGPPAPVLRPGRLVLPGSAGVPETAPVYSAE